MQRKVQQEHVYAKIAHRFRSRPWPAMPIKLYVQSNLFTIASIQHKKQKVKNFITSEKIKILS